MTIESKWLCVSIQVSKSVFVPITHTQQYLCPAGGLHKSMILETVQCKEYITALMSEYVFTCSLSTLQFSTLQPPQAFKTSHHQLECPTQRLCRSVSAQLVI